MSGFQTTINANPAPAVEGDFASANPFASVLAGAGQLVAGADSALSALGVSGVTVGRFAWARNDNGVVTNNHPGVASRIGFVQRDQISLITAWLAQATLIVPTGIEITLFNAGDFWGRFAAGAAIGQKVFASYLDGSLVAGTAGTPPTAAVTASFATSVMTVTVTATTLTPGQKLTFASVAAGTFIVSQATGTAGGAGTYNLSTTPGTVASAAGTVDTAYETAFWVESTAAATELAKISTRQ